MPLCLWRCLPGDLQRQTPCLGSCQCSGNQVRGAKHTPLIGLGAVNCCRGLLIAVLREGPWCCCCWFTRAQHTRSSLPSVEISSSKDLKLKSPSCFSDLLFPLFLSLCSFTSLWPNEACPCLHSLLHVPCHSVL